MKIRENNIVYNLKFKFVKAENYFQINCFAEDESVVLGHLTFKVTGKYNDKIFLYNIENTSEKGKGVGSALVDALEYFALKNDIDSLEGKYFPTDEHVKSFYEKRGYEIYKDGYETMLYKSYYEDEIEENVLPKIIEIGKADEKYL